MEMSQVSTTDSTSGVPLGLDGNLSVEAWRPLRVVSLVIPRSPAGNLVSVQGGFC